YYYVGMAFSLVFSSDGRTLAAASSDRNNRTIQLWESATGKVRKQFTGHQREISALAFAPDGKTLISGSGDATALIWDVVGINQKPTDLNAKQLADLDNDLSGGDGIKAFRAICLLATSSPSVVPFFQEKLKPVAGVDPQQLAKLIHDLDNSEF